MALAEYFFDTRQRLYRESKNTHKELHSKKKSQKTQKIAKCFFKKIEGQLSNRGTTIALPIALSFVTILLSLSRV